MKFLNGSKLLSLLLMTFMGLSILGAEALAGNIKRSCNAHYYGMVRSISFTSDGRQKTLNIPFESLNFGLSKQKMNAQGGCGKLVPNRCRKRARDKLLACSKAHVASPNQLPTACGPQAFKSFQNKTLITAIKEKACGQLRTKDGINLSAIIPSRRQVQVMLGVSINGKDWCGKEKPGKTIIDGTQYKVSGNKFYLREPLKHFTLTCP